MVTALVLAGVALLAMAGCATVRPKPEDGPEAGPAMPHGSREELPDDSAMADAGGIDRFILQRMQPDHRFRLYSFKSKGCGYCRIFDQELNEVQTHRDDLDIVTIDVATMTHLEPPQGVPMSILQYSDCKRGALLIGAQSDQQLESAMDGLKKQCEALPASPPPQETPEEEMPQNPEEETPPAPKEKPPEETPKSKPVPRGRSVVA